MASFDMNDNEKTEGKDTITDGPLSEQEKKVERTMPGHEYGRNNMREWVNLREENAYTKNGNFQHTMRYYLGDSFGPINEQLTNFGAIVSTKLDEAVTENDLRFNNPRIDPYNSIGDRVDKVVHHPSYTTAGDYIYGTEVVRKLATSGGLRDGYGFYFLANHVGEAGHNCPVICNFETARVLKIVDDFPGRKEYISKLEEPSYSRNYTSSQFLTEIQGGSDVGANDTRAWQDSKGNWFVRGEKWFCSNANAELQVISARRSLDRKGTKGLSMFLIPSTKPDGSKNDFTMRRLKEKMGTRALASAEIDYHDAYAIPLGGDFKFMLENVVHHSRIALAVGILGFASRAYQLATDYSKTRSAFGQNILNYPLVKQNLAQIKAELTAQMAGTYALIAEQDRIDSNSRVDENSIAFARLMANIGKSVISKGAVDNVHHAIDAIGGNGAIENTSSMPRLMRDAIILENWEGTHNTLYMQVLRDIHRDQHDKIYLNIMADRIAKLPESRSNEKENSSRILAKISADMEVLHSDSADIQSLKIASIVTQMANLFYYVCLVEEGTHQMSEDGCNNKLFCAELYYKNSLSSTEASIDDAYIALCSNIVDEEAILKIVK